MSGDSDPDLEKIFLDLSLSVRVSVCVEQGGGADVQAQPRTLPSHYRVCVWGRFHELSAE